MKTVDQSGKAGSANWQTVGPFEQAKAKMHRQPFRVTHELVGNPLFSLPALMEVAKQASRRPGDLYADTGDVKVADKWGEIPLVDRPIDEVLDRIQSAGAWIIMKHVEIDPAYAAVLNEFAEFVQSMAPAPGAILASGVIVMVSSAFSRRHCGNPPDLCQQLRRG